jgi:hypothetical protein
VSSLYIIRAMRSIRVKWWRGEHVVPGGKRGDAYGFWWGNKRERDHLADLGVDG